MTDPAEEVVRNIESRTDLSERIRAVAQGSGGEGDAIDRLVQAQERTEATVDRLAGVVDKLAAAQAQTSRQLAELQAAQAQTSRQLAELEAAQAQTSRQLAETSSHLSELSAAQVETSRQLTETSHQLAVTGSRVDRLSGRMGNLTGEFYEKRSVRAMASDATLIWGIENGEVVSSWESGTKREFLQERDRAARDGRISIPEAQGLGRADLIIIGSQKALVAEVSVTAQMGDVGRAAERASALRKMLGNSPPVMAAVIASQFEEGAEEEAKRSNVSLVIEPE